MPCEINQKFCENKLCPIPGPSVSRETKMDQLRHCQQRSANLEREVLRLRSERDFTMNLMQFN